MGIRLCLVSAIGLVLVLAVAIPAQVNTADLTVRVLDPQDAAMPGATVSVKSLATSATRVLGCNAEGQALFVGLPPGRYQLTVEAPSFQTLVNPDPVLTIGQSAEFRART